MKGEIFGRSRHFAYITMLIIAAALHCEAKPFIEYFDLKKDLSYSSFQVFRKEDIVLYITGTGPIEATIVTACFLTKEHPATDDFFLNVGICGSRRKDLSLGTVILCNKLIEQETGRTYFPDILYVHPFREGSLITSFQKQILFDKSTETSLPPSFLKTPVLRDDFAFADMEATALYQAGVYFFKPHQMLFMKIVSDYLEEDSAISYKNLDVSALIGCNIKIITEWIENLLNNRPKNANDFGKEEIEYISYLSENLKLSSTMEHELRQYLRYYKLVNGEFLSYAKHLAQELPLPAKSKTEGKKYLDYFKKNLL